MLVNSYYVLLLIVLLVLSYYLPSLFEWGVLALKTGDHWTQKPGTVRELQIGHKKVRENGEISGNDNQFLQAREGKHIE